jgi:hypothetical protein
MGACQQALIMASSGFAVDAVALDGTTDWGSRTNALNAISNGKEGLFYLWLNINGGDGGRQDVFGISTLSTGLDRLAIFRFTDNKFYVQGFTSGGVQILGLTSSNTFTSGGGWKCLMASWNLATPEAYLYVGDANEEAGGATETDNSIGYNSSNVSFGGTVSGASANMDFAELFFHTGFLDISQEANRRKIFSAAGKPVNPGSDGSAVLGAQPMVYLSVRPGDAASAFVTNRGTGGDFTQNGTFTIAGTSPSD